MEDPIAEEIIAGKVKEGDLLRADHVEGTDALIFTRDEGGFVGKPRTAVVEPDVKPTVVNRPSGRGRSSSKSSGHA